MHWWNFLWYDVIVCDLKRHTFMKKITLFRSLDGHIKFCWALGFLNDSTHDLHGGRIIIFTVPELRNRINSNRISVNCRKFHERQNVPPTSDRRNRYGSAPSAIYRRFPERGRVRNGKFCRGNFNSKFNVVLREIHLWFLQPELWISPVFCQIKACF